MTAPAKTESAIDDDRFSLTSGLTKSVEHLSELETISNSSMRVDVQVVKIADTTLMKRIEEFKKTPSGQMTVADFRSVMLEEEMDPPSFTQGMKQ